MEKFTELTAIAAHLKGTNIDTDVIIPSREMKRVSKKGLGEAAFSGWRYKLLGGRDENPDFPRIFRKEVVVIPPIFFP